MKRDEKNAMSKQRILDAAMEEFSRKGYEGASLNTVCLKNGIFKGIIYHYFKDKDDIKQELLQCHRSIFPREPYVEHCFPGRRMVMV